MNKFLVASAVLAAVCAGRSVGAFEFEKENTRQRFYMDGPIPIVVLGRDSYSVYALPSSLPKMERTSSTETHTALKAKLDLGKPVSEAEASEVLEVYFRNTAFDFDSVKVRNFKVDSQPTFVVWCGEWVFVCLEWKGAAGSWVEYEVNGRNRSGGMTGFQRSVVLLRKIPGLNPDPPVSSPATPASAAAE